MFIASPLLELPRLGQLRKNKNFIYGIGANLKMKGAKWENFVGSHLLKFCHFTEDTQGFKMELRFLRDNDKREVDFVVLKDKKPLFVVECKTGKKNFPLLGIFCPANDHTHFLPSPPR